MYLVLFIFFFFSIDLTRDFYFFLVLLLQDFIMKFFQPTCNWHMQQNRSLRSPVSLKILAMNSVLVKRYQMVSPRVLDSILLDRSIISPEVFTAPIAPAPIVRRRLAIDSSLQSPDIDRSVSSYRIFDETFSVSVVAKEIPTVINKIPKVTICCTNEIADTHRSLHYFIIDGTRYNRIDTTNWYTPIPMFTVSDVRSNISPVITKAALKQGISIASRSKLNFSGYTFTVNADRSITCTGCGEQLKRPQYFKRHLERKHLKVKIFDCALCDRSYCTADDLRLHYRRDHRNNCCFL